MLQGCPSAKLLRFRLHTAVEPRTTAEGVTFRVHDVTSAVGRGKAPRNCLPTVPAKLYDPEKYDPGGPRHVQNFFCQD